MKRIITLCLAVVLCLSICGCTMGQIRASQAYWDGEDTVIWNDREFIRLESSAAALYPAVPGERTCYVTEADVPTLLQYSLGQCLTVSQNGKYLIGEDALYCRSDCLIQPQEEPEEEMDVRMDRYCYDSQDSYGVWGYCLMSDEDQRRLESILATSRTNRMDEERFSEQNWQWYVDVYTCSEDLSLVEYAFEIWNKGDQWCILTYSNEHTQQIYRVWEDDTEILKQILAEAYF